MNQRLAAHKTRKGLSVVPQSVPDEAKSATSSRAAKAAARVAARYAQAPSYSEMQAAEARAALRAAGAATRAALEAQAAAEIALDKLETADDAQFFSQEETLHSGIPDSPVQPANEAEGPSSTAIAATGQPVEIRWDPDMPMRASGPPALPARSDNDEFAPDEDHWRGAAAGERGLTAQESAETVDPERPIHANVIHFPREIVATRRMRPRLEGSPEASESQYGQLSIFEVDPSTISTQAAASAADAGLAAAQWNGPEWSGIELDAQPHTDAVTATESSLAAPRLDLAPFGSRLMAAVVDTTLIVGFVCASVAMVASQIRPPLSMKAAELGAGIAIIATSALYHWLFLILAGGTPGMKYACISLCTFEDESPTREQLRSRLAAMLLSVLPVGLGVAWAIFDDDHLTWHDRLSRTYQRSC